MSIKTRELWQAPSADSRGPPSNELLLFLTIDYRIKILLEWLSHNALA